MPGFAALSVSANNVFSRFEAFERAFCILVDNKIVEGTKKKSLRRPLFLFSYIVLK